MVFVDKMTMEQNSSLLKSVCIIEAGCFGHAMARTAAASGHYKMIIGSRTCRAKDLAIECQKCVVARYAEPIDAGREMERQLSSMNRII